MDIRFQYNSLSMPSLRKFFLMNLIKAKVTWILFPSLTILYVIFFLETFIYSLGSYIVFISIPTVMLLVLWRVCNQWSLSIFRQEKDKYYYINDNGVGYQKPGVNYFLEWAFIDSIEETKTLILIRKDNRLEVFFYKFAIEKELLQEIEDCLNKVRNKLEDLKKEN